MEFNYEKGVKGFAMPIRVTINGKEIQLTPSEVKQTFEFSEDIKTFEVNRNFYIETSKPDLHQPTADDGSDCLSPRSGATA